MSTPGFPYQPRLITIEMVGARPFYLASVRAAVLDALLAFPELAPEEMSTDESVGDPFSREELTDRDWAPASMSQILRRRRGLAYELRMTISKRPYCVLEFPVETTPASSLPLIFHAGERLAAAIEPDMGWVHVSAELPRLVRTPQEVTQALMDLSSDGHPVDYRNHGPGGLGLRTFIGPFVLDQIGRERMHALPKPAEVVDLAWRGVRVDLAPEPWAADAAVLRGSWSRAMEHLRPAEFFATVSLGPEGELHRQRGARCVPGGQVRE